jgi:ammonia channel protein AmtB
VKAGVILANLLFVAGLAMISAGAGMIYLPAAFIVGGIGMLVMAIGLYLSLAVCWADTVNL